MIDFIPEPFSRKVLSGRAPFLLAREVFKLLGRGKVTMPPKLYLHLAGANDFRAMPAFIDGRHRIAGLKWVSVFPKNRVRNLPTVNATILLNSCETGVPQAMLEGNEITALRTGAAAAVASFYLARRDSKVLGIIGAGFQAGYQLQALAPLFRFKEIRVWGYGKGEAQSFERRYRNFFGAIAPTRSIKECVQGADVLVTCTPSRRALVQKGWVKAGAHINAIGADAKGKQELDPALLMKAKVVVDEWVQASHSGELNVPFSRRQFTRQHLYAELSEIVAGKKSGRTSASEVTIFDSTGLAALDVYFAAYVHRRYQALQKA